MGSRAVLQADDLELEPMPGAKIPLPDHQHKTGVAFRLDHPVLPGLEFLAYRRRSEHHNQQADGKASSDSHDASSDFVLEPIISGQKFGINHAVGGHFKICS